MPTQIIMDHTGDSRHTFDAKDAIPARPSTQL